jgi:hypothetical protein
MWHFADLRFADPIFLAICGLKTSAYISFLQSTKNHFKRVTFRTILRQRVLQYFVEICGFAIWGWIMKILAIAICGLAHLRNLRICDSGMSLRNCGFAICEQKSLESMGKNSDFIF